MASKYISPIEKHEQVFRELEHTICSTFQKLVKYVEQRRDKLLTELKDLRCENNTQIASVKHSIEELEGVKNGIESLSVNQISNIIQASLAPIISQIEELEEQIPLPNYTFECDINPIKSKIQNFGKILSVIADPLLETYATIEDTAPQYELPPLPGSKPPPLPPSRLESLPPSRPEPLPPSRRVSFPPSPQFKSEITPGSQSSHLKTSSSEPPDNSPAPYREIKGSAFCYGGRNSINNPKAICYDDSHNNIYVISYDDAKIYVFSSQGKLRIKFGTQELQGPVGICVSSRHCYVADDKLNAIFKFTTNKFELVKKTVFQSGSKKGQIGLFRGIALGQFHLYIVDNKNHRIAELAWDSLMVKKTFGQDYLNHPKDIHISQLIYVLDLSYPHCLHGISLEGHKVLSLIDHNDIDTPLYFCILPKERFIICGVFEPNLKIFSKEGTCVHTTEVSAQKPRGVCLLDDSTIACAFAEGEYVVYNIII